MTRRHSSCDRLGPIGSCLPSRCDPLGPIAICLLANCNPLNPIAVQRRFDCNSVVTRSRFSGGPTAISLRSNVSPGPRARPQAPVRSAGHGSRRAAMFVGAGQPGAAINDRGPCRCLAPDPCPCPHHDREHGRDRDRGSCPCRGHGPCRRRGPCPSDACGQDRRPSSHP